MNPTLINAVDIPMKPEYSIMQMNKVWLHKYMEGEEINENDLNTLKMIYSMDKSNPYIIYNYLYAFLDVQEDIDFINEQWIDDLIVQLNNSPLDETFLKVLNFKLLIKKYRYYDKEKGINSMARRILKQMDEYVSNEQNAMEIAMIFYHTGDFESAMDVLNPFLRQTEVNEETIYSGLAIGIHIDSFIYTKQFEYLMLSAYQKNSDRFCRLINDGKLPVQVLENPVVKSLYCDNCAANFR